MYILCIYVCVCTCVCVHIYIYIYTYIQHPKTCGRSQLDMRSRVKADERGTDRDQNLLDSAYDSNAIAQSHICLLNIYVLFLKGISLKSYWFHPFCTPLLTEVCEACQSFLQQLSCASPSSQATCAVPSTLRPEPTQCHLCRSPPQAATKGLDN